MSHWWGRGWYRMYVRQWRSHCTNLRCTQSARGSHKNIREWHMLCSSFSVLMSSLPWISWFQYLPTLETTHNAQVGMLVSALQSEIGYIQVWLEFVFCQGIHNTSLYCMATLSMSYRSLLRFSENIGFIAHVWISHYGSHTFLELAQSRDCTLRKYV